MDDHALTPADEVALLRASARELIRVLRGVASSEYRHESSCALLRQRPEACSCDLAPYWTGEEEDASEQAHRGPSQPVGRAIAPEGSPMDLARRVHERGARRSATVVRTGEKSEGGRIKRGSGGRG